MAGGEPRFGTLSTYMALMMPCSSGAVDIKTLIYMGMFERPNRPAFAQNQPLTGLDSQKFRLIQHRNAIRSWWQDIGKTRYRAGGVLHAKAVVADDEAMFVTSANFT